MVHNRQFIISKKMIKKDQFKAIELANGMILNYQENLNILKVSKDIILIGNAYSIKDELNLYNWINKFVSLNDVLEETSFWSGRWILLWHEYLIPDASALLNVYYGLDFISSSMALIAENLDALSKRKDVHISDYYGLNFFPSPLTPLNGIKRLMPGQVYNFVSGEILEVDLLSENNYSALSDDARVEILISWFDNLFHDLSRKYENVLLTLTGGHDSRTVMALLEHAKIDYDAFTMDHPRVDHQDISIAKELSERCGCKWSLIQREKHKFSKQKYQDFDKHTFGMIQGDRDFYAYSQYPENENTVILRNSVWENVICWYETMLPDLNNIQSYEQLWINVAYDEKMKNSLEAWIERSQKHNSEVDEYNRFFWEQRSGAWLSSLEQGLDILNGSTCIQICNCKEILTLLYSFSKEQRTTKQFEELIIAKACSKISEIPYAAKQNTTKSIWDKLKNIVNRILEKPKLFKWLFANFGFEAAVSGMQKNLQRIFLKIFTTAFYKK
ncbi:hypothetical protein [Blautia sp.]|uniref:hypothetical protein n=1 Tax=Blautia sp. TaxID=1955243 RepID=UPI003AB394A6